MTQTVMARHTEGPWELDDSEKYYRRGAIRRNGMVVAFMNDNWQPITAEERLANARLIAAAPDMLEALQHFVWWTDAYAEHPWFLALNEAERAEFQAGYDKASATIAKATGQ